MRKLMLLPLIVAVFALAALAQNLTVDEIIAKNIEARGGLEKLKAVKTMRVSGRISVGQGLEAPVTMEFKRPRKMRMEFTLQGLTGVQAYDGKKGWGISPFQGKKDPEHPAASTKLRPM